MRSILSAFCACAILTGCAGQGSTGLPPLPESGTAPPGSRTAQAPPPNAISTAPPARPGPQVATRQPTPITARPGPVTPSNPSTGIVDVNRSVPQALGPNSPPPSSFENSCAPAPYLFQSKAGYEAVRVKDCRNDQLVYLPTSAQAQINIYVEDCQRRCGAR
jgi:hypothetical protein